MEREKEFSYKIARVLSLPQAFYFLPMQTLHFELFFWGVKNQNTHSTKNNKTYYSSNRQHKVVLYSQYRSQ